MSLAKRPVRSLIRKYFPALSVIGKGLGLLYSRRSFLRSSGYIQSVRTKRPCRPDGSPIPWMNYNVISFFEERLTTDLSLFEYGSGYSTLFFAGLVGDVTSIECDRGWYEHIVGNMPENVSLKLCAPHDSDRYLQMIAAQNRRFDVIIVDAEDRVECLKQSPQWLTDAGVIVLDDAQRPAYQPGIDALLQQGFRKLDFEGLKPGGIRAYRTSIFYRTPNVLGL